MGRPRGSKNSKSVSKEKTKCTGPTSTDAKKSRSMDEVLGVGVLNVPEPELCDDEGEVLLPKSSLLELKK